MNYDEFAYFNQQLAAMLRDGIPLEPALQRLCADMRGGQLRAEFEHLQADLAKGVPLAEAARGRALPDLYRKMLIVGAQSNNLPSILTLLADYYHRRNLIWTRLKGLMVYPAIVLVGAFLLSCFLAVLLGKMNTFVATDFFGRSLPNATLAVWFTPALLTIAIAAVCILALIPSTRRQWRWRLAAFRENAIAQTAASLAIMLKSGVSLDDSLELLQQMEGMTPAGVEFARWRQRLAAGHGRFADIAVDSKVFPPLFVWTVAQSQENLSAGFDRAAELYQSRANYRADLLLYSALPCSILVLGLLIISQLQPTITALTSFMTALGSTE